MKRLKKYLKPIIAVVTAIIALVACVLPSHANVIWDTNTLGEFTNTNFDYAIAPLDNVSIKFGAGNSSGGYDSPYVYDITPTTFIPLSYWEHFDKTATGQVTNNTSLSLDSIKYNYNCTITPRTFTDWAVKPYTDYNAIEYAYNFSPVSIDNSDEFGTPTAVANNFYVRISQIFIDLSENSERQAYHYMVSTQTTSNNLEYAMLQVKYDLVVPYYERTETSTQFGFKKVKTVTRADQINANTGYSIIKDSDFTLQEVATAIGADGDTFLNEYPILATNISINMYTRCGYFAGNPPPFKYTISTPESPDYIISKQYDNWFFDVPERNVIDFENISWVDWFTTQIQSLLNVEIGLGLSFGIILFFVISVGLLFFFLKMFAGG